MIINLVYDVVNSCSITDGDLVKGDTSIEWSTTAASPSITLSWDDMRTIDNVTLNVSLIDDCATIKIYHSLDGTRWYQAKKQTIDYIYTASDTDTIIEIEKLDKMNFKYLKITFANITGLTISGMIVKHEETILLDNDLLEPFLFSSFFEHLNKTFKDSEIGNFINDFMEILNPDG